YKQIVRIKLDEDDVLNYYWRAFGTKGFYSDDIIKEIKETFNSFAGNKIQWIKDFISGLSKAFETVERIETSTDGCTIDLRYLNNMALAYPFIIKAYHVRASESSCQRLIKLLENLTFRYLLRGGRAEIESRLNPHLTGIKRSEEHTSE